MKKLSVNSIFNVIYNLANVIFPLIIMSYASRILRDDGVGIVAYGQNIASYFVVFATLGLPMYGVREIAKSTKNAKSLNRLFTELFSINFISSLVASILYIILIFFTSLKNDFLLYLCCGVQIFMNFFNIDWLYQGLEEYVYISCRSIVIKIISLICIFLFVKDRQDYIIFAFISSFAICANYLFNVFHARKFVKFEFGNINLKKHIYPILILGLTILLSSIYSKADITMMGGLSNNSSIGLYNNAHKIVDAVIVVCTSISATFLPQLSIAFIHDKTQFYNLIETGISWQSFFSFPLMVGCFVLSPIFVPIIFGSCFIESSLTVQIFTPLIVIKSFCNLLCYQLVIATGNEKKRIPAYLCAAFANVVLNAILIPSFHQNGAAFASVISELIVNGILLIVLYRQLRFKIPLRNVAMGFASSIVMGGMMLIFIKFTNITGLLELILAFVIGSLTYIGLNIVFKNEIAINFLKKVGNLF